MTTAQDYCTALDKLNAAIREVIEFLDAHPASQEAITLELPKEYTDSRNDEMRSEYEADGEDIEDVLVDSWRLRYDRLTGLRHKVLFLEFLEQFPDGEWRWTSPFLVADLSAHERMALAPYLPLLIKRADDLLELRTGQLEQNVQAIYEALEAAKKNTLPTAKPAKKRK
jgi:hypothetical protein